MRKKCTVNTGTRKRPCIPKYTLRRITRKPGQGGGNAGGGSFLGAYYMSSNYLLGLQIFGKGTPTSTHTATIYSPDKDGVQTPYAADQPVWRGSRANRAIGYFNGTDTNVLLVPSLFPGNTFDIAFKWRRDLADAVVGSRQDLIRVSLGGAPYYNVLILIPNGVNSIPRAAINQSDSTLIYAPQHTASMPVGATWDFRFWADGTNLHFSMNGVETSIAYDGTIYPTDPASVFVVGGTNNKAGGAIHDLVVDGVNIPINEGSGTDLYDTLGGKAGVVLSDDGTFWSNAIRNASDQDFVDDGNRFIGYFNGTDTNVLLVQSLFPGNTFDISFKWRRDLQDALVGNRQDILRLSLTTAPYYTLIVYLDDGVNSVPRASIYQSDGTLVYTPVHSTGMPVGAAWDFRFWADGTEIHFSLNGVVTSTSYDGTVFPTDPASTFIVGGASNRAGGAIHDLVVGGVSIPFNEGSGSIVNNSTGIKAGDITAPSGTFWSNIIRNENGQGNNYGVLLDPPPQLVSQPLVENLAFPSHDLSGWTDTAPVTFDQVGIDGKISASRVEDNSDTTALRKYTTNAVGPVNVGDSFINRYLIKKQTTTNGNAELFSRQVNGGVAVYESISFNPVSGQALLKNNPNGTLTFEIHDKGEWWDVYLISSWTDTDNLSVQPMVLPTAMVADSITRDVTLQGSIVVGNVECYVGKTVAQLLNSGPIFTTGTAVATDAVNPEFDVANLDNDAMVLSLKVRPDGAGLLVGSFLGYGIGPDLMVNGGFETGNATGWNRFDSELSIVGNQAYCDGSNTGNAVGDQKPLTAGEPYMLRYSATVTSGSLALRSIAVLKTLHPGDTSYGYVDFVPTGADVSFAFPAGSEGYVNKIAAYHISASANQTFSLMDTIGNQAVVAGNTGQVNDVGIVVHKDEGKMALYVNGTWSADVPYSGELHDGKFDLGRLNEFPAGYYDIRVTKGGTFDELKLKITNALSTQAGSVNSNPGFSPGFNNGFH